MICLSDIIKDIVLSSGYKTMGEFCRVNGLRKSDIHVAMKNNAWSVETLKKIGAILKVDLTTLTTVSAVE